MRTGRSAASSFAKLNDGYFGLPGVGDQPGDQIDHEVVNLPAINRR